jgi:succinate dehydrogenase / fumarate reductase membrane anchor subunit
MSYSNKPKIQTGSKTGMHHWLMQRVTAIILTLSGIWLLFFGKALADHSMEEIVTILQRPENILPLIIFSIIGFYHGALGMQVVIEDYVPNLCTRYALILLTKIFTFITIICTCAALIYLMVL